MMTRDREHEHEDDQRRRRSAEAGQLAGKHTLTEGLVGPNEELDSGLAGTAIQRKTRDANGVSEDAESAVATASTSSGTTLPANVMRKFESSLGADLSSVRVHTGAESAHAADAVGARAYTVGQDIHFGEGEYDPSSAGGEHLLAHEVAHTVQQQGGSSARQHKLEVSGPQDAAEDEADRAADAMIEGRTTEIGSSGGVARKVMREIKGGVVIGPDGARTASITVPAKKIPEYKIGGYLLGGGSITLGGSLSWNAKADTPPADPAAAPGPKPAKVEATTGTDTSGELKSAVEVSKQLEGEVFGGTPKLSGGVEVTNKSISVTGFALELTSKWEDREVSFKPIELKLVSWEIGQPPQFAVAEMTSKVKLPIRSFQHDGTTYAADVTGSVTVSVRPDPAKVAQLVAEHVGPMITAELAVVGGLIAGGALALGVAAYNVLSKGDATRMTEPEIRRLRNYCLAFSRTIRGQAPPGGAGAPEAIAEARAFLAPLEARYPAGAVAEAAKLMPDPYATAWNQTWPKVKAGLIEAYWQEHSFEKFMTGGTGYGNGGFKTFSHLLDGWDAP